MTTYNHQMPRTPPGSAKEDPAEPPRVIGPWAGLALVVGSMLGVGIFLAPPIVAKNVVATVPFLLMWVLGGVVSLSGAVAFAELGTAMPRSGGEYVIQREALGSSVAFASGWVLFGAIFSGSIAMLCVAVCEFQFPALLGRDLTTPVMTLFGWSLTQTHVCALLLLVVFTVLNIAGGRLSGAVQSCLTVAPTVVFVVFAVAAIIVAPGAKESDASPSAPLSLGGMLVAYDAVYFAYSGWPNIIYVAGEVARPSRNIPASLLGGTAFVTVLYLLICTAFVHTLGMGGLSGAGEAGTATASLLWGASGRVIFALFILLALLASINATILGGARILYAMALEGAAGAKTGKLGRLSGVPVRALWIQAAWTAGLILTGGFVQLLEMASVAMFVTGSLTVLSLFVLRRRHPQMERPYRATGYPLLPAFYLVASMIVCVFTVVKAFRPDGSRYALLGLMIFLVAFVVHRTLNRRRRTG